jgi:hypothetical protein
MLLPTLGKRPNDTLGGWKALYARPFPAEDLAAPADVGDDQGSGLPALEVDHQAVLAVSGSASSVRTSHPRSAIARFISSLFSPRCAICLSCLRRRVGYAWRHNLLVPGSFSCFRWRASPSARYSLSPPQGHLRYRAKPSDRPATNPIGVASARSEDATTSRTDLRACSGEDEGAGS